MRKIIIIIVAILLFIPLAYSAFWYIQSSNIRSAVETRLETIADNMSASGGNMTYSNISTSGFPFDMNVIVSDLNLEAGIPEDDTFFAFSSSGDFVIGSGIGDMNHARITLPNIMKADVTIDGASENIEVDTEAPMIDLYFNDIDILDIIAGNTTLTNQELLEHFQRISYTTQGSTSTHTTREYVMTSSQQPSLFDLSIDRTSQKGQVLINVTTKSTNQVNAITEKETPNPLNKALFTLYRDAGKTDIILDASASIPQTAKADTQGYIHIHDIDIACNIFGIKLEGKFEKTQDDFLPHGRMVLSLRNYSKMLDAIINIGLLSISQQEKMLSAEFKQQLSGTDTPPQNLTEHYTEKAQILQRELPSFIQKFSDTPGNTSPSITITLERQKLSDKITIGSLNLAQAQEEFLALMQILQPQQAQ